MKFISDELDDITNDVIDESSVMNFINDYVHRFVNSAVFCLASIMYRHQTVLPVSLIDRNCLWYLSLVLGM